MRSVVTRFRAYHLDEGGSSFSYFADGLFTMIEGRLTVASRPQVIREMRKCGVDAANNLHITGWDADHCKANELSELLELVRPRRIECPGYEPCTDNAIACRDLIEDYRSSRLRGDVRVTVEAISPEYIGGLSPACDLAFKNVFYNPLQVDHTCVNDNSTVKHFRTGSFNVLSLGDVESSNIAARFRRSAMLGRETDVMLLAHHGADNGFTSRRLLRALDPRVAVCSSNYGNQYDHPRDEIRDLLHEEGVRLYTTKTGDVVIKSIGDHTGAYRATNMIGWNKDISSIEHFVSKKRRLLGFNGDTLRQVYAGRRRYS